MFNNQKVVDLVMIESDDKNDFANRVGDIIVKENVVDIKYSTVLGMGRVGPIMIYSALLLIGSSLVSGGD